MRFLNIPLNGCVCNFQVSFHHDPFLVSGKENKHRLTSCTIYAMLPVNDLKDIHQELLQFAKTDEKCELREFKEGDRNYYLFHIATGFAECSKEDQFSRAIGRKVSLGRAVAAINKYCDNPSSTDLDGNINAMVNFDAIDALNENFRFDFTDETVKAFNNYLQKHKYN